MKHRFLPARATRLLVAVLQVHAYDAETGKTLFYGGGDGDLVPGTYRFNTLIAVNGRIFVAANTGLYAFTP